MKHTHVPECKSVPSHLRIPKEVREDSHIPRNIYVHRKVGGPYTSLKET